MPQPLQHAVKGGYSLSQKRISPFKSPQEKGFRLAISISNDLFASGMEMLARSVAAFRVATRLASAPTIRCCAACLIEVRSNFRLPIVPTNAASEAMPLFRTQSAAEQTSLAPHDSKARLRPVTNRRDSWRSHVHRTHTAQRVQSFKIKTANVRGQGAEPLCVL